MLQTVPKMQGSDGFKELERDADVDAASVGVAIGSIRILEDVSMSLQPGQFHAIIGQSGSGKTTFLRALTGEVGYSGDVHMGSASLRDLTPEVLADRRGVLPQSSILSFPLTVTEVLQLGLMAQKDLTKRPQRRQRIHEALVKVGLAGYETRTYQDLSGGEQQRVQLARVLCQVWEPVPDTGRPRWLFLDEPVSSLDIAHQVQIMEIAADYAKAGGGVLAIMHDLNLTATYADHVFVMKAGEKLMEGSVEDVFRAELLSEAYDFPLQVTRMPVEGTSGENGAEVQGRIVVVPAARKA